MLQPRVLALVFAGLLLLDSAKGSDGIGSSPRRRRQEANDVTTVLLVDNHGRSSFGRFLSVKPDLGLITSTARTFIQEGVTTEYATQVLGTTLDNGRLYAHLLTKSSRVLYDGDSSRAHDSPKKWNLDSSSPNKNFIKNTDFISPNSPETVLVFPTTSPDPYSFVESNKNDEIVREPKDIIEEEILKESPSNNFRVPYEESLKKQIVLPLQNNVKVFKINPQMKDLSYENIIVHKDSEPKIVIEPESSVVPSKVKEWQNLPTFTVRNEFSPSGLSFLGDFPDFDSNTERSRPTTVSERKAKLLFKAGLAKPNPKDLKSITYTGFADFTTTVGDTVIIFTPHTAETSKNGGQVTKISVEPTLQPSASIKDPQVATTVKTFLSHEPGMQTQTVEGHKLEMKTVLPTMVIDKTDRSREGKSQQAESVDMDAKSAVLAHEQQQEVLSTSSGRSTIIFNSDLIQPSESQIPMLSTPSDEDIAKIFASLQAQAAQATQPLNTPSTVFFDEQTVSVPPSSGGATTIFFEDDLPIQTSQVEKTAASKVEDKIVTTTEETESSSTTEKLETTEKPTTTTPKEEITTTEKEEPTTIKQETTTNEIATTPEIIANEIDTESPESPKEVDVQCTKGIQILPTTVYKTLTYLTTFFIPEDSGSISTSIRSNEVVSTEIGFETLACNEGISPSSVAPTTVEPTTLTEPLKTTTENAKITTEQLPTTTEELEKTTQADSEEDTTTEEQTTFEITTPQEITTERRHVTESEPETTEAVTDSGEDIELIFKTLYTTYTYLTTYFQESTSSVASRIVVTTNVITSTLDPGSEASDPAVAGLLNNDESLTSIYKSKTVTFEDFADIAPTSVGIGRPTETYQPNGELPNENDVESNLARPTPVLDDKLVQTAGAGGIKTYYTTYTYFTTIFVDGETEISSRTEVYTNYVTPNIQATAVGDNIEPTELPEQGERGAKKILKKKLVNLKVTPINKYNSTINRHKTATPENQTEDSDLYESVKFKLDNNILATTTQDSPYVTLQRGGSTTTEDEGLLENNLLNLNDYETISTMVTDVRSSTSEGERRVIDNVDKRNVLDDQIVSESNNDSEIIPSPTLLLQTSYTTFTYFTTMYQGTTSSNVVSRLETVTNVVTQTLTPTHTLSVEDLSLPITYFTTFTYWTTLYKDGTTKVTSREETVSNVVTPSLEASSVMPLASSSPIAITKTIETVLPTSTQEEEIKPSSIEESIVPSHVGEDELTTYYTTYTYYTTSYVGDSTVLNSRLETVTNVLNKTNEIDNNQLGRAIGSATQNKIEETSKPVEHSTSLKPTGLLSTITTTVENSGTQTLLSTDVFGTYIDGIYAQVLESTSSVITESIAPSSVTEHLKPTGVVSINQGKIVDAEGISTLLYTTQAIGTYVDNRYAQVIQSTSTLTVDEAKKSALGTDVPVAHKTGLVRLIEGSIIQNDTTTVYESKVLGTIIDGRYAQVIESTSSFLVGKPSVKPTAVGEIVPTPTQAPNQQIEATKGISPSPVSIEGSLSETVKGDEETSTEETDEDEDKDDGRVKSRLTFQSRKRTFTPAIRPFASRQRPTFAPKRKGSGQSTAATITRSDFTPTVTAVPASKSGRFGGRRSSSTSNLIQPTSSRKFSRPKATGASSGFGGRRSSGRIQPTASGFGASSRRPGGFRSSSGLRSSSLFNGSSRARIRPTAVSGLNRGPSSKLATPAPSDDENDITTSVTDDPNVEEDQDSTLPVSTTTEVSRRNQNPLLRFRRPPLSRPSGAARTSTQKPRSGNLNRTNNKATTTTAKPKPTFARSNSLLNRPRPNALFPRRGLFTTTTTPAPEEEFEDEELVEEDENEEDTDYDSSKVNTQTANPPTTPGSRTGRSYSGVSIKPFVGFRRRSKRETTYSRFRRPTSRTTAASVEEETEAAPKIRSRFPSRGQYKTTAATTSSPSFRKRITPSKPTGRSQFTLREKDTSRNSYKRPTTRSRTTARSRIRNSYQTEPTIHRKTNSRQQSRTTSRRGGSRHRYSQEDTDDNFVVPRFDGTITVTHQIPTEVTIPVVNGKITEYKNVVTAKYSTEVLDPRQYSTSLNPFGKEVKVLLSEATSIDNGATLITQFVLNETPTTSIIFTPTYIRGRKTSFSHVVPSTVYAVEPVVNTIQPALAAQAPLANILLSQLLLGGLQPQNPLLGLQNPAIPAIPATPSTEFKTRTTTYVTTVTSVTSTVIPLTFRGKEIVTTIVESSVDVVTATEFLTDTVVVTPTLGLAPNPQLNTLLLPLLQQQLAQQAQPQLQNQITPAGVSLIDQPQAQALYQEPEKFNLAIEEEAEELEQAIPEEIVTPAPRRKSSRKNKKKPAPVPQEPPKETSVITLYVSGRHPGEFSTVLSTVIVGEENNKRKREAGEEPVPVQPSKILEDLTISTLDYFDSYVMPASKEVQLEGTEASVETQSLESILGDVTKHLTQSPDILNTKPTKSSKSSKKYKIKYVKASEEASSGHFLA